ncbi:MAG: hypothetical protein HFF17_12435 [Oscillospiraceae bacterium]|nr:hypothetical protein [Oscillospiraceae bacterium]
MNRKIAMTAAAVNLTAVLGFAASMLAGFGAGSYFSSMFIAFGYVGMACAFAYFAERPVKLAGYLSLALSAVYAAVILLVYFTQLTTVRLEALTDQAASLLDFQKMGLFFNLDLLGYALMALSTFFAGLTIRKKSRADRALRALLLIHGVFFFSCLIMPVLGVFRADSPAWVGTALLEFWCAYFCPIGILSLLHFSKCRA